MKTFSIALLLWSAAALAAPGGNKPSPPLSPTPPAVLQYLVQGSVANQADGKVALILRLLGANGAANQIALAPTKLLEETQTVTISNGRFTANLGAMTAGGIPPALVAGRSRLFVEWSLASAPTISAGSVGLFATPVASTLSPGAAVAGGFSTPALTVSNTGVAVHAQSSSPPGRGIQGAATATSGVSYGVEGQSASPAGAGGDFINTGAGGDLIHGRNGASNVVFRVTNSGDVYTSAGLLQESQGPPGPPGSPGQNNNTVGPPGPPGPEGNMPIRKFCLNVIQGGNHPTPHCQTFVHAPARVLHESTTTPQTGCSESSDGGQVCRVDPNVVGVCCSFYN